MDPLSQISEIATLRIRFARNDNGEVARNDKQLEIFPINLH